MSGFAVVDYDSLRPEIRSGDLVFFRGKGIGPWFIRTWTKSRWSHCGIAWVIGERVLLLEAHPFAGVRAIPMSEKHPDYYFDIGCWNKYAEAAALDKLAESYGWLDCARAGIGLPTLPDSHYQCAEYAVEVLRAAGLSVPGCSTPDALFRWAEKCC